MDFTNRYDKGNKFAYIEKCMYVQKYVHNVQKCVMAIEGGNWLPVFL